MSSLQHSTETWFVGSYETRVDSTNTTFEGIVSKFLIEQLTTVRQQELYCLLNKKVLLSEIACSTQLGIVQSIERS